MDFELSRLRKGEWIMGVAALALLVILFAVPWYGLPSAYSHTAASLGAPYDFSGWESMTVIRFFVLAAGLGGLVTWYLQTRCLAPALPVSATVLETALSIVTFGALYYRIIIIGPTAHLAHDLPASFVGLALSLAMVVGGYLSLRADQAPAPGSVVPVERLSVPPAARARS